MSTSEDEAKLPAYAGIARAERRDQGRRKQRDGMQVTGASVKLLARVAAERARERAAASPASTTPRASRPG